MGVNRGYLMENYRLFHSTDRRDADFLSHSHDFHKVVFSLSGKVTYTMEGTIYELRDMMRYLMPDEAELKTLAEGVVAKLESMTDAEYDELSEELSISMDFESEDAAYGFMPPFFYDDFDPDEEPE